MSTSSRQLSLAANARSLAALAEPGEASAPPSPVMESAKLPGGVYTPTGDGSAGAQPYRGIAETLCSQSSSVAQLEIPYQFTLVDLNTRSYFFIHEVPDTPARTQSGCVNQLRENIRQAVILANIEVCFVRNWQLAGRPGSVSTTSIDLSNPSPAEPPETAAERKHRVEENNCALAPVAGLLSKYLQCCGRRDVSRLLEERLDAAEQLLQEPGIGYELMGVEDAVLHELAFTLAAYQPAVLDEEIKGSQSPCDPRSGTKQISNVEALVERSVVEAGTDAPERLANLAVRLLDVVRRQKHTSPLAGWLLQGGCMSGQSELVCRLLDGERSSSCSGLLELDIIRRLRTAWLGYQRYRPLQPLVRVGRKAHTMDWLDFKCSCARAVLIAHKIIETLLLRDDKGLTLSVQMAAKGAWASPPQAHHTFHVSANSATSQLPISNGDVMGETAPGELKTETDLDGEQMAVAEGTSAPPSPQPLPIPKPNSLLDNTSEHMELEPSKWGLVRELFPRAAACKPLALAMLHVVLEGKRKVQQAAHEAASAAAAAAADSTAEDGSELPPAPGVAVTAATDVATNRSDGDEADDAQAAAEAAEAARLEEEARSCRYRRLHLLAVQAAHLAVHSGSLSTVSDAVAVVRAVRAWPALNMGMLNDLAKDFPNQCAALLEAVPLQEVDLEDNVLPFALPPGFFTVAVSDKDAHEFRQGGGTGSTQDAAHFATQREEDVSIEASLLTLASTWMSLMFLFWPVEFKSPTTRQMMRVLRCALAAFVCQGPGSCGVALVFGVLIGVIGVVSRVVVAVGRILCFSILYRIWRFVVTAFPAVRRFFYRVRGRPARSGRIVQSPTGLSSRTATQRQPQGSASVAAPAAKAAGGGGEADSDDEDEGSTSRHLGLGIWRTFFAHGHSGLIDRAVGWGRGSASISCRKLPMPMMYASQSSQVTGRAGGQLDTALLEKLLDAPGLHPSVFGSRVVRALILFKWNYFTKYFIILQLLLHITYMAVFLAYAFTIKNMEPVDGRESGPGANTPGCQLQEPSTVQTGLLITLAVMTVDFLVQEMRQIRHFGFMFFTHPWDILDVNSIALVVASVTLHFSCTSGVSPLTLRGLAAVQIVLLFMRLFYYAMASDKLGSFVRMVIETTYDLSMFFAFLAVVFVGFALAMIISQGSLADEEQTFIKLFTMMYGDFDVNFLSEIESGALGLDALTRVLASVYMILVTIILLNLLISVISESYERIRENEKWESLRNKALLIVETETLMYQGFLTWLYTTLTPPSSNAPGGAGNSPDSGQRYLYVIAPEYARHTEAGGDDDNDDDAEETEEVNDDGQWNGRLGEMKRHITTQSRVTLDALRKEMSRVVLTVESLEVAAKAAAAAANAAASANNISAADVASVPAAEVTAEKAAQGGTGGVNLGKGDSGVSSRAGESAPTLDERCLQLLAAQVGALISKEMGALRKELSAEIAKGGAVSKPQQPHQDLPPVPSGRLSPLQLALGSLPPLTAVGPGGATDTAGGTPKARVEGEAGTLKESSKAK